jgi:hypothetical protein
MRLRLASVAAVVAAAQLIHPGSAQASCGSAFCGVNTNWDAQGLWDKPGLRADLRFEFIDQDQPRHGNDEVAVGEIQSHHDEVRTLNRNWLLNLDYGLDAHWGVSLVLPYVDRDHEHIHHHHGQLLTEAWDFGEAGDARVIGRYQFAPQAFSDGRYGLKFGLKLPSGDHEIENADGDRAERTLQPGSGTTDLILGAYFQHAGFDSRLRWFGQALWQQPLAERADFRPGYQLALDAGLSYAVGERLSALLQANVQLKGRDVGDESEREDSGSRTLAISPGIAYAVSPAAQVYAFVQLPVYQYVNGVQLTADVAYVAGVSLAFD